MIKRSQPRTQKLPATSRRADTKKTTPNAISLYFATKTCSASSRPLFASMSDRADEEEEEEEDDEEVSREDVVDECGDGSRDPTFALDPFDIMAENHVPLPTALA